MRGWRLEEVNRQMNTGCRPNGVSTLYYHLMTALASSSTSQPNTPPCLPLTEPLRLAGPGRPGGPTEGGAAARSVSNGAGDTAAPPHAPLLQLQPMAARVALLGSAFN